MSVVVHVLDATGYRTLSDLASVAPMLGQRDTTLWIDADESGAPVRELLERDLRLHPLIIEDIFSDRTTPKLEDGDGYLYIVMHGVKREGDGPESLCTIELDVVLGTNWVFTHHAGPMPTVDDLHVELARNPKAMSRGAAFVAHALIDRLTDDYLPVVDRLDDEIEELETSVIARPSPRVIPRIFALRRSIQRLRRVSIHQRELLQRLSRGEFDLIPAPALPFYRDVYDHFVRIADLADSYREFVSAVLETYMSVTANRTNEIMKVLAIISTIMLPLTFIAGVYGMNFEHMPELHWRFGYAFAIGLMVLVAVALVLFFRRRGWFELGASPAQLARDLRAARESLTPPEPRR